MRRKTAAIPFILVTLLIDVLGLGLLIPILPELINEFTVGDLSAASTWYGAFIAVYAAMQFLFAPVLGALSDRFGRRPVLLVSLLGAGLDYLLMAVAPTLGWLFVGRVLAGITGANITAANAYIADVSSHEDRAKNFGLVGAVFGVGFIIGPALGGLLGGYHLRLPFYVAAALALVNWLYGFFILPESLAPEHRRPVEWSRLNPLGMLRGLARYPVVLGLAGALVAFSLAQQALQSTWVLFTSYRFAWTPFENGLSLTFVGVLTALVQGGLVRLLVPRLGERRAIITGFGISAVTMTLYGLATQGWMMYAVMTIGALAGIAGPSIQSLVSRQVSPSEQGTVQGALASLMSLTGVVGPLVATQLFSAFTAPTASVVVPGAAFFLGAALSLLGLALVTRALRRGEQAPPRTAQA